MRSREKWAMGFGLLAGAAVGFFLASEKGKELRRDANQKLNEYGETVSKTAKEQAEMLSANIDSALAKSRQLVDDLTTVVKEKVNALTSRTESMADSAEDSLQKGIDRARRTVKEKSEQMGETTNNKV